MIKVIGLKFCPYLHTVRAFSTVWRTVLDFSCFVFYHICFFLFGHFSKKFAVYYGEVLLWLMVPAIKHRFCSPTGDTTYCVATHHGISVDFLSYVIVMQEGFWIASGVGDETGPFSSLIWESIKWVITIWMLAKSYPYNIKSSSFIPLVKWNKHYIQAEFIFFLFFF